MSELKVIEGILNTQSEYVRTRYRDRRDMKISTKRDANDVLTEVDLAVQASIVEVIRNCFPNDHIVAEEAGLNHFASVMPERCWFIDPIDGTQNFVRGLFPVFGISVAFAIGGRLQAGGVAIPMLNDIFLAERGNGATRNGVRIRVSTIAESRLARAEVDFSHPLDRQLTIDKFSRLICTVGQVRCHCAAVIGLCSVAAGEMEAYLHVDFGLSPWDYAAGQLIVEEAGGCATRLDGGVLDVFSDNRGVMMSNGLLHEELLSCLASS